MPFNLFKKLRSLAAATCLASVALTPGAVQAGSSDWAG